MASGWTDFVEAWMDLTEGTNSPDSFRLWTAISLVGMGLERRVWAKATRQATFPNLYVLLTGAPGVGKQVVSLAKEMLLAVREPGTGLKAFRIAPSQMTKASLVDSLAKAKQLRLLKHGNYTYHSLLVAAEEFQVLLPTYDQEYIATLNEVFNNPTAPYEEARRTGSVRELSIDLPQLNILAGVQPSYFVSTFPEEAWTTGFARRIIMVYAGETPFQELFQPEVEELNSGPKWDGLLGRLAHLSTLWGQMSWEPEAGERLARWHRGKGPPQPTHSKLVHYNNSRTMFAIKLSIISAVAATGELVIRDSDVRRALGWLLDVESRMPDVFREMLGKSDTQVIDELHYMVTIVYAKSKKAVGTGLLWEFLRQRVPSEKIEKILLTAERSGALVHPGGAVDLWIPKVREQGAPE